MIRGLPYALGAAVLILGGGVGLATQGAQGWPLLILGAVLLGAWLYEHAHHHDDHDEGDDRR